jgi:hypothetical protein
MVCKKRFQTALLVLVFACTSAVCHADMTLALNKAFVNKIKNKATLTTNLNVDSHPNSPHAIKNSGDDGDIHMAGRDSVFKLPLVAEILNARIEPLAMQKLKLTSSDQAVSVSGVWRIWFEHPSNQDQIQGKPVLAPADSNPDHVCELHPITKFAGVDVLNSFVEIKDDKTSPPKVYEAYTASKAFPFYDDIDATIQASNTAIMITSVKSKFNYTEFVIELAGKPKDVGDGFLVLANVFDKDNVDEPAAAGVRRMVFVKGTPPADKLMTLAKGEQLHVLGIPRVNLNDVFAITGKNGTNTVEVKLPYEMIIAAILPTK